jgi:DsbC/DsbD-like thiol-disulfide interchange protein
MHRPRPSLGSTARRAIGLACCWLAGLATARTAGATASPWASNPQSRVRLVSAYRVAPRTGELRLGLQFRLAPGWHVYWKNSGDAGFAPAVELARWPGLAPPELLWPAPHRYELPGGLLAFGYAGEVVYPIRSALDAAAGSGPLRLAADVDYLVCQVDCIPYRYTLSLDQPIGERAVPDPETAPLLDRWWGQLPLAADRRPGVRVEARLLPAAAPGASAATGATAASEARATDGRLRLELGLRGVAAGPGGADLFVETHPALELGRPRVQAVAGGLLFEVPARRKDLSAPLPASTEIAWTATGLLQGGRTLALAGRQRMPVPGGGLAGDGAHQRGSAAAASAPPVTSGAPPERLTRGGGGAARRGLEDLLAAGDPLLAAIAAVAATLLALERFGLLARRPSPPDGGSQDSPVGAGSPSVAPVGRGALGFLALLAVLGALYALSLEIGALGLAGVEIALLAMGLLAWLRQRAARRRPVRLLLAACLAACAVATPWLAQRYRTARAAADIGHPAAGMGRPALSMGRSAAGMGRPAQSTDSSAVGMDRPAAGRRHPAADIGRPAAGMGHPSPAACRAAAPAAAPFAAHPAYPSEPSPSIEVI